MIVLSLLLIAVIAGVLVAAAVEGVRNAPRQVSIASTSARPPHAVSAWVRSSFVPAMRRARYRVVLSDERATVLHRTYWPPYVWVASVLLFPIGLLTIAIYRRRLALTVSIEPRADGGTDMLVAGEAPGRIAQRLDGMR